MNILLCVSSSVAIYKSCELIRILKKSDCNVKVALSNSASEMISPKLFEAISENEVFVQDTGKMEHISLVRWCDVLVLCPATATTIGNIANGIGGSLLLDIFLAKSYIRTIIAPAMNCEMWNNIFVRENISRLEKNGFEIIQPQFGMLACGEEGMGKLANIEDIASCILSKYNKKEKNILITAGGTIEKMDDVRYLTNISSGKQALEIAQEFYLQGWCVTVVKAKTDVEFPKHLNIINVESGFEMLNAVESEVLKNDVFVSVAAVADFTFVKTDGKIKKTEIQNLKLIPNQDILATISYGERRPKCVVGFCAEGQDLLKNVKEKMQRKKCDIMVGNDLVFGKNLTSGIILQGHTELPFDCSKKVLAQILYKKIADFISQ